MVRKVLFWGGWILLLVYAIVYGVQVAILQDLPAIAMWKWGVLAVTALLIFVTRNREEVFEHHLPH